MGNQTSSATESCENASKYTIKFTGGMKADVEFLEAASAKARELKKIPVVLVGSGAFCPVHRGHLLMMRAAAKALPTEKHVVVGTVLIPASDMYIHSKLRDEHRAFRHPFELRTKLIRATASDLDFKDTGDFPVHICDAEHTGRAHGTGVIPNLRKLYKFKQKRVAEEGGKPAPPCPALVWVNGDDKAFIFFSIRVPRTREDGCDGVVVVSRQHEPIEVLAQAKAEGHCGGLKQIAQCVEQSDGVSSSRLRAAVEKALLDSVDAGADTTACAKAVSAAAAPFMSPSAAAIYAEGVAAHAESVVKDLTKERDNPSVGPPRWTIQTASRLASARKDK